MGTDSQPIVYGITNYKGKYPDLRCGEWICTDTEIIEPVKAIRVLPHPLTIVEELVNRETGTSKLRLAYKRRNRWVELVVPRSQIAKQQQITELTDVGIMVTSNTARLLIQYLNDLESMNDIPVRESTSKLGWVNGDTSQFAPYDSEIEFDGELDHRDLFRSIHTKGDADKWFKYISDLRSTGRIELKLPLVASFGSVLMGLLNSQGFIIDLYGFTESGKSVSQMVACSVWANPLKNHYIGDFEATHASLESKCDMLNHLPLFLDDTAKVQENQIRNGFASFVYRLASGKGKSRSNKTLGTDRERKWSNITITNGEHPLSGMVSQSGAKNRIISIECEKGVFEKPADVVDFIKHNYGHAGRRWVEVIKAVGIEAIEEMYRNEVRQLRKLDGKMAKQINSVALLSVTDKLINEHIFEDNHTLTLQEYESVLSDADDISEFKQAHGYILDRISMNYESLTGKAYGERWGRFENMQEEDKLYAILYREKFNELCTSAKVSDKQMLKWLAENGLSKHDKGRVCKRIVMFPNEKQREHVMLLMNDYSVPRNEKDGFKQINFNIEFV